MNNKLSKEELDRMVEQFMDPDLWRETGEALEQEYREERERRQAFEQGVQIFKQAYQGGDSTAAQEALEEHLRSLRK